MGGDPDYGGIYLPKLNNFYKCKFIYMNMEWTSSEQAYQSLKFSDKSHIDKIRNESEISLIYHYGQDKYADKTKRWKENEKDEKLRLMYEIVKSKVECNEDIKEELINTKNEIKLVSDRFWGVKSGKGENNFGKILMRIREEIIDKEIKNK